MAETPSATSPAPPGRAGGEDRVAAIRRDQRSRWLRGDRVPVEHYLSAAAGPTLDAESALLLIHGEYLLRRELGEAPPMEEYERRFPDLADRLRTADSVHRILAGPPGPEPDWAPEIGFPAGYEVLGELGRGGMGIVYKVRQRDVGRVVALKMIRPGAALDAADIRRFRLEAEAAAGLDHPHIVPVHEVGRPGEPPYFSMRLLEGGNLQDRLGRPADDPRDAARLVLAVAEAVHHAHQRGILHRDLKPANILLDAEGRPYVCDFGLARAREGSSSLTRSGAVLGTPSYMAPEQATGGRGGITTAADVYGLGAILYALLTGRPPFLAATPIETLRRVIDEEPTPLRALNSRVDRDLEAICLAALDKRPRRRYASASAMAEDLEGWLSGRPIRARRIHRAERAWKWAQRHPAVAALSLLLVLVAATGLAGMLALYGRAVVARVHADGQAKEAQAARVQADDQAKKAVEALRSSEASLYTNRIALADRYRTAHDADRADELLDECPPALRDWEWRYLKRRHSREPTVYSGHAGIVRSVALSPDGRYLVGADEGPTICVRDRTTGRVLELPGFAGGGTAVAISPDGRRVAAGGSLGPSRAGSIKVWSTTTWAETRTLGYAGIFPMALAFSPDGRRLASGHDMIDDDVRLWDVETGSMRTLAGHRKHVTDVAFSPDPDGRLVASASRDQTIRIWDARTGEPRATLRHDRPVYGLAFHPGGRLLIGATGDLWDRSGGGLTVWDLGDMPALRKAPDLRPGGGLTVWDLDSLRPVRKASDLASSVHRVRFSPDGRRLATASWDRSIRIWDAATLGELLPLMGHAGKVWGLDFSRDGHQIVSGGEDGVIRIWDATPLPQEPPRRPLRTFAGHERAIQALAATPDGRRLVSAGEDGTARVWDVESGRNTLIYRGHRQGIYALAVRPDGRAVASGGDDEDIRIWDPETGQDLLWLPGQSGMIAALAYHPDGARLVSGGQDGTVRLWDVDAGRPPRTVLHISGGVHALAVAPDGSRILAAGQDGVIHGWDLGTEEPIPGLRGHTEPVVALAIPPSAYDVAATSLDGTARVFELTGVRVFDGVRGRGLAWSPDGQHLAVSGANGSLKVWEPRSGRRVLTLRGHDDNITGAVFLPDGRRLATAGWDCSIKLWETAPEGPDLRTGESRRLPGHATYAWGVAVLPDGHRAVSGGDDGTVRVWDLQAGRELRRWATRGKVWTVVPTPDGTRVLVAGSHPGIRLLDLETGQQAAELAGHDGFLFAVAVTPDGRHAISGGGLVLSEDRWRSTGDSALRVWDLRTGREVRRLEGHDGGIWSVAVAPDGRRAASASMDGTVRVWDVESGRETRRFGGHEGDWATTVAFLPDGRRILSGGTDHRLILWDAETGREIHRLDGHRGPVDHLAIAPDGRRAVSSGILDHQLRVWDLETGRGLYHYEVPHVALTRGTFTLDGRRAIWGASDGALRLWDLPERFETAAAAVDPQRVRE